MNVCRKNGLYFKYVDIWIQLEWISTIKWGSSLRLDAGSRSAEFQMESNKASKPAPQNKSNSAQMATHSGEC
jgi:hypothetical protein